MGNIGGAHWFGLVHKQCLQRDIAMLEPASHSAHARELPAEQSFQTPSPALDRLPT